jgi:hypothetical protein
MLDDLDKQIMHDKQLERAALIAAQIEDDNFYHLLVEERTLLKELSGIESDAQFDAQLKKSIFLERKCKQKYERTQKRSRNRLMWVILVFLCNVDPILAWGLCSFADSASITYSP